jgi:hypothetical protein
MLDECTVESSIEVTRRLAKEGFVDRERLNRGFFANYDPEEFVALVG